MADIEKIKNDLKQMRDELELKLHLGSVEAKEKWEELEGQWGKFSERAEIKKTVDDIDDSFDILGEELKKGYKRLKDAL